MDLIRQAQILLTVNDETETIRITTGKQELNKYELMFGLEKLKHHLMQESYEQTIKIRKKDEDEP